MKVLSKQQLGRLFGAGYDIIGPTRTLSVTRYRKLSSADEFALDILNTTIPPKDVFFPHTETMFDVKMERGVASEMTEAKLAMDPSILFAMRPCDAHSLTYMDALFNWNGVEDTYWNRRRELVTIFVMGCNRLCPNSFCTSMGSGPASRDNADVFIYEFEDRLILDPVTEKGRSTLEALGLDEAGDEDRAAADSWTPPEHETTVDLSDTPERLGNRWDDENWEEVSRRCLNCGICTFLCPSCNCFDIVDIKHHGAAARCRVWDSCQFDQYSVHASGHQPRETKLSRVRNRILHKFNYIPLNFDMFGCVGCGRCTTMCPSNIDLLETIREVEK